MSTDLMPAAAPARPHWTRSTTEAAADALTMLPIAGSGRLAQMLLDRRDQAVWIFVVVAVVIVLAAGGALAWAYAYCVSRGGSFDGGLSADWSTFSVELRFKCTQ